MSASTAINLDTYTDPVAMRALLQAQLPGFAEGRLRIDALAVSNVLRNTSRERNPCPMTLCYELQASDPAHGRRGTQWLYAQVYRSGLAAAAFAHHEHSRLAPPAFGDALVHLADLDLLLWALPNDPGLPQLTTLLDPARAALVLPGAAGCELQVELLRYRPQRRASLRYTFGGSDGAEPQTLYAKTFCDQRGAAIHERFTHFWQLAQDDATAPLVARPLGYHAATRTVWQAPAVGLPLLCALASHNNGPALMGQVARALALLHAAPLAPCAGSAPRSVAHWLAEVRRRRDKIGRIDAALALRAARVTEAIEAGAAHPASRPLSLIHGDFHPEQIWVHEGRVVLFDFDEFTLGDPLEDIAEFAIKLGDEAQAQAFIAAAAATAGGFDPDRLRWHLAVQSLLQASRAFIFQRAGWRAELASWLARAEGEAAALAARTSA